MHRALPAPCFILPSDKEMTELESRIQRRLGNQLRHFHLVFSDQGLILRGRVPTYYAKQLVQHAVMETIPLPIAANEIEVV
jgi:hypothetical protein